MNFAMAKYLILLLHCFVEMQQLNHQDPYGTLHDTKTDFLFSRLLFTLMHLYTKCFMWHSLCFTYSANSLYFHIVYFDRKFFITPFVFCLKAIEVVMIVVVVVAVHIVSVNFVLLSRGLLFCPHNVLVIVVVLGFMFVTTL